MTGAWGVGPGDTVAPWTGHMSNMICVCVSLSPRLMVTALKVAGGVQECL